MAGLGRTAGIVVCIFSVGIACTQLFGGEQNTLAPIAPARPPTAYLPGLPAPGAKPVLCGAGEVQCEGALLQTCADDLSGWVTLQRCAAAALCQPSPASCLEATCGVDEMTCSGSVLQKCNVDRTGWELFDTCLSPAHCNAELRQCKTEPCTPGDRRCDRSELDQSPVLEVCRDDQLDWAALDACVTRELCDQTLTTAISGGLVVGSDGQVTLAAPTSPTSVLRCNLPACAVGEVRCDGAELQLCAEGRTGWTTVEECASSALCTGSLGNVNAAGAPLCLGPACGVGQHQCTAEGVLQVCSEDRTGFRTIQACIGPPFCNAALADQGQEGCRSAPCQAGDMQCNGAQIEVCRQDRTGLDASGQPCETAALCNADDTRDAFCEAPACRRGGTSGDEFRCEGAELQRCNETLTGYDQINTCATAALCDASQRFNGCRPPVCAPGQYACSPEGFLETCNADRTEFEAVENCGSRAQCDANAGRCSDPCVPGTVRCNTQSGDLEECRDPLVGWRTIGDCVSLALCDAGNRRCNPPACAAGERRCETRGGNPVVMQCAPGREGFAVSRSCAAGQICDAQNNECDVCAPNSASCDGDTLVRCDARGQTQTRQNPSCGPGLCSASKGRCLVCNPINSARCVDLQLRVCAQGQGDNEFERSENCDTDELCAQTLTGCGRGLNGQNCQCNDGVCAPNQLRCQNGSIQRCNGGLTGFDTIQNCANGCNPGSTACNECQGNAATCVNNQLRRCVNGFFQNQPCQFGCAAGSNVCNDCQGNGVQCINNNSQVQACVNGRFQTTNCGNLGCNNGRCNECQGTATRCAGGQIQRCANGFFGAPTSCSDNNVCNGTETCNAATNNCAGGQGVTCNDDGNPCTNNFCDPARGCSSSNVNDRTQCVNNDIETCRAGVFNRQDCGTAGCANGSTSCNECTVGQCINNNSQFRACNNGRFANPTNCTDNDNNPCTSAGCDAQRGCFSQLLSNVSCSDNNACTGNETCQNGVCSNPADVVCAAPAACRTNTCNPGNGNCVAGNQPDGTRCNNNTGTCRAGTCVATCTTGSCNGLQFTACNNGQVAAPRTCPDDANNSPCIAATCDPTDGCDLELLTGPSCTTAGGAAGVCSGGNCIGVVTTLPPGTGIGGSGCRVGGVTCTNNTQTICEGPGATPITSPCTGQETCQGGRKCGIACGPGFGFDSCGPDNLSLNCSFGGAGTGLLSSLFCSGSNRCDATLGACVIPGG